jgi:glycosyltransferase involved in cell wall biosynthesis
MNILFYTPVNFLCRDVVSLILELRKNNHNVILLSQGPKGPLNFYLEAIDVSTYSFVSPIQYSAPKIFFQVAHLIYFCWKHRIGRVFSHLEPTNLVAVLAQFFILADVTIYRHHLDLAKLSNFDKTVSYRMTYWLARTIITVSSRSKEYMSLEEKINPKKIYHINLAYDFNLFPKPDRHSINKIKIKYKSDILLVVVGRLDKFKRPQIALDILEKLVISKGLNAKLLFLGTGELEAPLKQLCATKGLTKLVFFLGFVENVMNYLSASNFLIHPSLSESSSVAIKEAALANLPVIVCKGVGDFDDYLEHNVNGFLVHPGRMVEEATSIISENYQDYNTLELISSSLRAEIIKRFSIDTIIPKYNDFIS